MFSGWKERLKYRYHYQGYGEHMSEEFELRNEVVMKYIDLLESKMNEAEELRKKARGPNGHHFNSNCYEDCKVALEEAMKAAEMLSNHFFALSNP